MKPSKSTVYSPTLSQATALADKIGVLMEERGIIAAGCPVGDAGFVSEHADKSATKVESLVHTLMDLQLSAQDKLLLLRKSLRVKVAHFARCAKYEHIKEVLTKSEDAITNAVLQIIGRDHNMLDV
jgi:hypothetical protein